MQWVAGIIVAGVLLVAGLWAGTNIIGGATLESPPESPDSQVGGSLVDVGLLRDEQRLSNSLFEVVPGEVIARQGGYSIRVRIRNLDPGLTLKEAFWGISAKGYNERSEEVPVEASLRFGDLPPDSQGEGTAVLHVEGLEGSIPMSMQHRETPIEGLHVELEYNEPGRTAALADFLWPYGR